MNHDFYALSQKDASRLTVAGDLARAAGWPAQPKELECFAFFRSDGELLCAPASARTPAGRHPFERAIETLQEEDSSEIMSFDDLPSAGVLAKPYRIRQFSASWVGTSQINFKLGAAYLSLLGWIGDDRPPIYPVAKPMLICLFSHRKMEGLQRLGITDF